MRVTFKSAAAVCGACFVAGLILGVIFTNATSCFAGV